MMDVGCYRMTALFFMVLVSGICVGGARNLSWAREDAIDPSLRREARAGMQRGLRFLEENQKTDGSWQNQPAITGLVVMAMLRSGRDEYNATSETVENGLDYIRGFCQDDGGIYDEFYASYSTSICVMALQDAGLEEDRERIAAARRYLLDAQADESEDVAENDEQYGGWGYEKQRGEGKRRADMSNTQFALSALHMLEQAWQEEQQESRLAESNEEGDLPEGPCRRETQLAYDKAIKYLERCQNNDGGFIYRPDESKAGTTETGALRSYGGMTYAGLKSLIYARVERDDPRVQQAVQWLTGNWSVKENPGMGQQGLYYYYQTMAKCLDAYGETTITDSVGDQHNWRRELISRLLNLQQGNGSWINESGRWMESILELVTAYSLLALEGALDQ